MKLLNNLSIVAVIYSGIFHLAYYVYIFPKFEYAGYIYIEPKIYEILFTYALIIIPLLRYRSSYSVSSYGVELLYVILFVPAQVTLMLTWARGFLELAWVQINLSLCMYLLLRASKFGIDNKSINIDLLSIPKKLILTVTLILIFNIIINNHFNMRFVSFEDVYNLRSTAADIDQGFMGGYSIMWLQYCFLPYFFARGIVFKEKFYLVIGGIGSLVLYMAVGSKAAILMYIILYGVYLLYGNGKKFLYRVMTAISILILLLVGFFPDDGIWLWFKSIILVRILGSSGWTMAVYYDFFTENKNTYYTHIGVIKNIFGGYPYGDNSLGQVIAQHVEGLNSVAEFNANFWASDGFAALGIYGILIITVILSIIIFYINNISRYTNKLFLVVWFNGFWFSLMNLPLSVSLISGGGILIMAFICINNYFYVKNNRFIRN